jgi:hypothetical protein
MIRQDIESKWGKLKADGTLGYKSLRVSSECIPDLFIGVDFINLRCLILKLPDDYKPDFQSIFKQNISLEIFPESKWIILKLLNLNFTEIFNDLIISFHNCIMDISDVRKYTSELIRSFQMWSEFFDESKEKRLSLEEVQGIFGELFILHKFLSKAPSIHVNTVLKSWTGPYGKTHDFVLDNYDLEIKTKEVNQTFVHISSEYQLQNQYGKGLSLKIISVKVNSNGAYPIKVLVLQIRDIIINKTGDVPLFLKSLRIKNITLQNIHEYDEFRFEIVSEITYDCLSKGFPSLTKTNLPPEISNLNYNLNSKLHTCFLTEKIDY